MRAQEARKQVRSMAQVKKTEARKARDHQLYSVAGLLSLVGLVDKATGKPIWPVAELVGMLDEAAKVSPHDPKRQGWRTRGATLMNTAKAPHRPSQSVTPVSDTQTPSH
ncbi:MAG: conjugal transfer protein TraD [Thiolinea sp.]